jgi:signal transduction histidine kinase
LIADHLPGAALRADEVRLRLALDVGELGTWTWNLRTGEGDIDERGARIVGLVPGDLEGVREAQLRSIHPDDLAMVLATLQAGIAAGGSFDLDYRVIHPDGTTHHVDSRARVLTDDDGTPLYLVGTNRDVTAERAAAATLRADAELKAHLVRLADAVRPLRDPVAIQAEATRLLARGLEVSRVMYGEVDELDDGVLVVRQEVRGPGAPSAVGRHRLKAFGGDVAQAFGSGRTLVVPDLDRLVGVSPSERAAYARLRVRAFIAVPLVKDGRLAGYLSVSQESPRTWTAMEVATVEQTAERTWAAVEQARAEAALREGEARYRSLFQSMDQAFCIIEVVHDAAGRPTDYRFLEANASFQRQTGLADPAGRLASELVPGLEAGWSETYGEVARTGEPARFGRASDVMGRTFDVYAFPVGDPADRRVAILFTDVTEERRAAGEREALLEREREGRAAAEAFLAVMSHELRTPVTTVYGTTTLLRKDPTRPDLPELLGDIEDEAERLLRIIDDLLVLSRVERGLVTLDPEPLLVPRALDEVLVGLRRRYPAARFEVVGAVGAPMVLADPTAVRQVLHNLLSNAAKYAGSDGPVTIELAAAEDRLEVSVLDRGPGLGDDPESVFGLFVRAPHTARRASGTGIGLYVARQLVAGMGGRLVGGPREGGGARVCFDLPLASEEPLV